MMDPLRRSINRSRSSGAALRWVRDVSGVGAIEFAMLMPVFASVMFLIVQFGYKYYYTSVLHEQAFVLAQSIIQPSTRPADLAAAKGSFAANLKSAYGISAPSSYVLHVGQVTASTPSVTPPASDSYAPQSAVPVLIRIVYPAQQLLNLTSLMPYWPALFGNKIDVSIVIVPK